MNENGLRKGVAERRHRPRFPAPSRARRLQLLLPLQKRGHGPRRSLAPRPRADEPTLTEGGGGRLVSDPLDQSHA